MSNLHYSDVIMGAMTSQITGVSIVYSTVCSGGDQSTACLAFVRGIHRWRGKFPAQRAINAENVSIDDVIMKSNTNNLTACDPRLHNH